MVCSGSIELLIWRDNGERQQEFGENCVLGVIYT